MPNSEYFFFLGEQTDPRNQCITNLLLVTIVTTED